ncbi:MAG: M50 family metallopeptidase, partial [Myxococcota bacterium]
FFEGFSSGVHWSMGLVATIGLFVSILAHELAHALVARRRGIEVDGITLFLLGGMAEMREEPRDPVSEILIAGAGPVCSLLLGGLLWIATRLGVGMEWPPPVNGTAGYLAVLNLLLGLFNLVPAFPLDGGRVLRAVLWGLTGNHARCTNISVRFGMGLAWAAVVGGSAALLLGLPMAGLWLALVGLFMRSATKKAWERIEEEAAFAEHAAAPPPTEGEQRPL